MHSLVPGATRTRRVIHYLYLRRRLESLILAQTLLPYPPAHGRCHWTSLSAEFPPREGSARSLRKGHSRHRREHWHRLNTGIGYEIAKQLLLKNAKVYLAARSADKAALAIKRLEAETNKAAIFLPLDLGDLPSMRKAAEQFLAQEEKLDILFNNAGVMNCPPAMITAQGYDLQFGTNVIGHWLLTELLLPALKKSYEQNQSLARIINISSSGHLWAPGSGIDFVSLKASLDRDAWVKEQGNLTAGWRLYAQSKIGNIYISNHWAKTHSDVLVSCAVHPGAIWTEISRCAQTSLLPSASKIGPDLLTHDGFQGFAEMVPDARQISTLSCS
ncbi:hypothetical protein FB45DRAFT_334297, partial [Roridomyces roridus]